MRKRVVVYVPDPQGDTEVPGYGRCRKVIHNYCPSTHGGAGYAEGSRWEGDAIICGLCGERIERPYPTGYRTVYSGGFLGFFQKKTLVPKWPEWIKGDKA